MTERPPPSAPTADQGRGDLRHVDAFFAVLGGERDNAERCLRAIDGDAFRRWCLRQQIGGFAYLLFDEAALDHEIPPDLLLGLRASYLEQWARAERLRLHLAELARLLREMDEEFLVLKGLPYAQRYYGAYDRRTTGDLDVLVPRERAHAIALALEERGLSRRSPRYGPDSPTLEHVHQVELELEGTDVELHHVLRAHPTFRIDERRLRSDHVRVEVQGDRYATLSDEHALLLHLLGLHTDVQIGQANVRWFCDLDRMLVRIEPLLSWEDFFAAREAEGTRRICVNSLALFLVLTRGDERFPALAAALDARRGELVLAPDRLAYLDLLRGSSMVDRKSWPLRQYEGGTGRAVSWWLAGMPRRIAAKPGAFARDVSPPAPGSGPWEAEAGERGGSRLESDYGVDPAALQETSLRFGSLRARVHYESAAHLDAIEELFRLRPHDAGPFDRAFDAADLTLHVFYQRPGALALQRRAGAPLHARPLERLIEIQDGIVHLSLRAGEGGAEAARATPGEAWMAVDRDAETRPRLLHSVMVVLNKMLSLDGRYHLHAAAAALGGTAALFVGGKGSGKSTITLAVGRAGATVYSEDHVMLRRDGSRYRVSGCDGKMHLTEASERHFFDRPLPGRTVERAGVSKKQVDMGQIFDCRPYVETEVGALFFPSVGVRFDVRPLAKEEALARLLEPLLERHRFADDTDRAGFLDVFAGLVESCETWELTLSRDLSELSLLVDFLAARAGRTAGAAIPAAPPYKG